MSLARKPAFAVTLPLVLAACGDDPVKPGDELTAEEAEALLRGTMAVLWDESALIQASEDSVTFRCPHGGQVRGLGKQPDEEFSGDTVRLVVDYRFAPSGCGVTGGGTPFTVDGDPSFRYQLALEHVGSTGEYDIAGGFSGGVTWQLEDRSGDCAMDLTLMAGVVGQMLTGSSQGTLCGHEVELDVAGLVPPDL